MFDFNQKIVLVTGAGGGSGEAIARKFLANNAIVIAADLKAPAWGEKTDAFYPVEMDVSDEDPVNKTVQAYCEKLGGIDILINNAGIAIESPLIRFSFETWKKIFSVNADGTFLCTKAAVKSMVARKIEGRVINIASIAGKNGFPNSSGYCASKAAVIGFTRALAAELGQYGITVNAICPGSVATPMIESVIDTISANSGLDRREVRRSMESGIALKRFQQPEDVADLVCFLASDYARNINGESMNLDGGVVRD